MKNINLQTIVLFFILTIIPVFSVFAQGTNESMLNNKHKITFKNNHTIENGFLKLTTTVTFPKNYFATKAIVTIEPNVTTSERNFMTKPKGVFKGEAMGGKPEKTIKYNEKTTVSFKTYSQLKEGETIKSIDLNIDLDIKGVHENFTLEERNIQPTNNDDDTEDNIENTTQDTVDIVKNKYIDKPLSLNTVMLKSDSLKTYLKTEMYKNSGDNQLEKIDTNIIIFSELDKIELKKSESKFLEFENNKEKILNDTLKYLNTVVEVKQIIIKEIRNTLEKEISKPITEQSSILIDYLHKLLLEIEHEIFYLKEEISHTQIKILKQKEIIKQSKVNLLISFISFFALLTITIILFILFKKKKQHNKELKERNVIISSQNEEIKIQNESINEKNKKLERQKHEILSSINYASRIQTALLPTKEQLNSILKDYFVFYSPRDIVSGDYYWSYQKQNTQIIIAADCTGHGVPGAFMSALGISFLNEIIVNKEKISSADILNKLRNKIKYALKQTGKFNDTQDGMDMSVCVIDKSKKQVNFAGANNSIYLIRNKELTQYKADKQPIGIYLIEKDFSDVFINYQNNDIIYMFSDGFPDQFGGKKFSKFKTKRFKKLLLEIADNKMNKQKELLSNVFWKWKGKNEQTDDVLVFGIKL